VPEAVIAASIALDALLLRGDLAELRAAGMRFRAGTEAAITRELRAIPVDRHHLIDHHYIAGRLKPSCWRPWADDSVGFPQARYLAALASAPSAPEETVNSYPVPTVPSIATVPAGTWLYATSALEPSPDNIRVDPGRDMPYLGQPASTVRIVEYVDAKGVHQGRSMFEAVIALVVAFGLSLAPDQIGAILAVTAVVLGLITRSRVSAAS
jgi:hypothetical protein